MYAFQRFSCPSFFHPRCWKDEVVYDENKYLAALAKRHLPLAAVVAEIIL
jgi:hypothetical protein